MLVQTSQAVQKKAKTAPKRKLRLVCLPKKAPKKKMMLVQTSQMMMRPVAAPPAPTMMVPVAAPPAPAMMVPVAAPPAHPKLSQIPHFYRKPMHRKKVIKNKKVLAQRSQRMNKSHSISHKVKNLKNKA